MARLRDRIRARERQNVRFSGTAGLQSPSATIFWWFCPSLRSHGTGSIAIFGPGYPLGFGLEYIR
jgi:hypothetical protein